MYERYYSTCQGMCREEGGGRGGRSESGVEAGRRERERYKRRRKTERPGRDTEGDGNEGGRMVVVGGAHASSSLVPPSRRRRPRPLHTSGGRVMLIKRSGGTVQLSVCWGGGARGGQRGLVSSHWLLL